MGDSRYKDNLTTLAKRLRPLMLSVAEGSMNANEWGKIIRVGTSTADVQIYEPTEAGVTAALGDCSSGHNLYFPSSITIALTSGISVPDGVSLKNVNLSFSGFSGVAITLGDSCGLSGYAIMDGTGEATATCIEALDVSLTNIGGHYIAQNATTNIAINGRGAGQLNGLTFSGTYQARNGTDSRAINAQEYCYSTQATGQAYNASASNLGVVLAGSISTDESYYPHLMNCWGIGIGTGSAGLVVADGKYGSIFNSHFYGVTKDILVGTGSFLIIADSSWNNISNSGTITHFNTSSARVYNSANISIPNTTLTALTFNSERYDTSSIHSTSTNTGRLTATSPGKHSILGNCEFAANTTGIRNLVIRVGGSTVIANDGKDARSAGVTVLTCGTEYDLAIGDYVELLVYQSSGGALNVNYAANKSPVFMMTRIG